MNFQPCSARGQHRAEPFVSGEKYAGCEGKQHAVDVVVGHTMHAVDAVPAIQMADQPGQRHLVIGVGDVDHQIAAQAQHLGSVEHHLNADRSGSQLALIARWR
ncbi:hypothetical protein F4553_000108 [Allocatelliglobosispora scoriae]|uniref:Uncharacterized protein n=1 Tax=Allocatelliglobosispora scoriae TaxID=643052 RepID=A0A841BHS1_9ACTN|nr:hypothetical protein [Allocatelliglobosispora scoriae]MBB5866729.1 hypothetical protein [Allocatelliglobosispora scoriae]